MSRVALVILNYNGSSFLKRFLPILIEHSQEAELIVADNCSSDDSLEVLNSFPAIRKIILAENTGYAGGYNESLKQIDAEYYLLVNSDIEVTAGWIKPLIGFLDKNEGYAAVQPKILDYHNKEQFEYSGASGGFIDSLGYPYCRGRIFTHLEKDTHQYDSICDVFWATGACFLIRSSIFHELGGFDASFFAHMEEVDLFWRLKSAGYKAACVPSSYVYHVGGGTLNKSSPRKTYLNFRNNLRLLIKNLPSRRLVWILPLRIILDWAAALLFWKKESFAHFKAVFKAHLDALKYFNRDIKNPHKSPPTLHNLRSVLLLKEYYINKKKRFNEINSTK
ncbi:MAG: glycosyltransferase family 2 protein [Marinoscillum sp.]